MYIEGFGKRRLACMNARSVDEMVSWYSHNEIMHSHSRKRQQRESELASFGHMLSSEAKGVGLANNSSAKEDAPANPMHGPYLSFSQSHALVHHRSGKSTGDHHETELWWGRVMRKWGETRNGEVFACLISTLFVSWKATPSMHKSRASGMVSSRTSRLCDLQVKGKKEIPRAFTLLFDA